MMMMMMNLIIILMLMKCNLMHIDVGDDNLS